MVEHHIKSIPMFMAGYYHGFKTWSIRLNDRDYQRGDWLIIAEWSPDLEGAGYSGVCIAREVLDVSKEVEFVKEGYVVLSLGRPVEVAPDYRDPYNGDYLGPPGGEKGPQSDGNQSVADTGAGA